MVAEPGPLVLLALSAICLFLAFLAFRAWAVSRRGAGAPTMKVPHLSDGVSDMAFIRLEPGDLELIRKAFATTFTVVSLNQFATAKYRNIADQVGWLGISIGLRCRGRSGRRRSQSPRRLRSPHHRCGQRIWGRPDLRALVLHLSRRPGWGVAAARTVSMSRRRSARWRDSPHRASCSFPRAHRELVDARRAPGLPDHLRRGTRQRLSRRRRLRPHLLLHVVASRLKGDAPVSIRFIIREPRRPGPRPPVAHAG